MLTEDLDKMWERIFNYPRKLWSGRIEKGYWLILFILLVGGIFALSWWKDGPVGGFTFTLVLVMIWNIAITKGLLKQSERASKQSRNAFLTDVVLRVMLPLSKDPKDAQIHGIRHVLDCIEPGLGGELKKLFETFVQKAAKKR